MGEAFHCVDIVHSANNGCYRLLFDSSEKENCHSYYCLLLHSLHTMFAAVELGHSIVMTSISRQILYIFTSRRQN
jgi:hypothetical protein